MTYPPSPSVSVTAARPGRTGVLVVAAVCVAATALLTLAVAFSETVLEAADVQAVLAVHAWMLQRPPAVLAADVVTTLGSPLAIDIAAAVVALVAWSTHCRPMAIGVIVARVGELLTETAFKALIDRPRPNLDPPLATATSSSYPSGHSAGTAAVIGFVIISVLAARTGPVVWRTVVVIVLGLFVLAVPLSRVALGVHHPSDVVGGLVLGLSWAAAVQAVLLDRPWDRPERPDLGADPPPPATGSG